MRAVVVRPGVPALAVVLCWVGWGSLAAAAPALLGVDATTDTLISINTTTGASTPLGAVANDTVAGLAYDPNHNILFGSSTSSNSLLHINPATGATTVIGPFGVPLMHGLEYDPVNDALYGMTYNDLELAANALYRINPATGQATLIGTNSTSGPGGLAFDPLAGVMYTIDSFQRNLFTLNLTTGAATLIGPLGLGVQPGTGLAYDPVLGLFASDNGASPALDDQLFRVNTSTGAATLVGNLNTGNVLGLAFIPEPGSATLAIAGLLLCLPRARRPTP